MKFFFLIAFLLFVEFADGQDRVPIPQIEYSPEKYICYRTSNPIQIDGIIDEKDWLAADWTKNFVDIEGLLKPLPYFETRVKMLWDSNYFYFAAELEEPQLWATLKNRDDIIFYDNDFEIFIDPDADTYNYYELELNAFNTVWDLLIVKPYRDGGPAVHNWDINGLLTAVKTYGTLNLTTDRDTGWTIEVGIPWSVLKECSRVNCPPLNGDQWKVNFSRVEWETEVVDNNYSKRKDPVTGKILPENNWVWSPQGLINMHYPEMWGLVQFTDLSAGSKESNFIHSFVDEARYFLRNIYYRQKEYFIENKKYASRFSELGLSPANIPGFISEPTIQVTKNLFEARLYFRNSDEYLVIYSDGLIISHSK
ncbi:MAG: carbohydrate-binding family 9-like protein [Ignavibacteriaceae bacterium]|nr:carbohydrate-binding family 9-like protein [Ignavibacteriaceae bacterium]